MGTEHIQAIDVHAHYGDYDRGKPNLENDLMTGDARLVVERARRANVRMTVASPLLALMPRGKAKPVEGNIEAIRAAAETEGLLQWVVIDPQTPETYRQADEMLKLPKCVGIDATHSDRPRRPERRGKADDPVRECREALGNSAAE